MSNAINSDQDKMSCHLNILEEFIPKRLTDSNSKWCNLLLKSLESLGLAHSFYLPTNHMVPRYGLYWEHAACMYQLLQQWIYLSISRCTDDNSVTAQRHKFCLIRQTSSITRNNTLSCIGLQSNLEDICKVITLVVDNWFLSLPIP